MKKCIRILASVCALTVSIHAQTEESWTPSDSYTSASIGGWRTAQDADTRCQTFQYRLLYLLESHRDAKDLRSTMTEGANGRRQIYRIVDHLEDVLLSCYLESVECFQTERVNPTLLLMMLYHYKAYIEPHTANEGWSEPIEILEKVDSAVTREADKLSKQELDK